MSKKSVVDQFAEGEIGSWRLDDEHQRDMISFLRNAGRASLFGDLPGLQMWQDSLYGLENCLWPYTREDERTLIETSRPPPLPDLAEARRYHLPINISFHKAKLREWERVLRRVLVAHGFGIRAGEPGRVIDVDTILGESQ